MKIYIAILEDRHSDTTAHPFSNKEKAIEWARSKAKEDCLDGEDYAEGDFFDNGWVFYAEYSCEGDCVYVVESELDKE